MKAKILQALKTKYSNLGFSEAAFEALAGTLSGTGLITDENLETAIAGSKEALTGLQADSDRRVAALKAENDKLKEGGDKTKLEEEEKPDTKTGNPEYDKLMQAINGLTQTVTGLVEKDKTTSLKSRWEEKAKAKGITNPKLIEKWMPKSEEDIDANLTELEEFNTQFLKESANADSTGKPAGGGGAAGSKKANEMLENWAKKTAAPVLPAETKV